MTRSPALVVTPLSALSTATVFCRLGGALWATVVVKATFQLVHGESARRVAPLPVVLEDRTRAESGSLEAARETAPHLPGAGVLLTGHACAPEGKAVPSMSVRLGVSRDRPLVDKTIHVFGARAIAAPQGVSPFQKMPLVYERAFGGAGVWQNPVGTGGPMSAALPNLVDPKDPRRVAGFGPVAAGWMPRRGLLGGVDAGALSAPVWEVPAGFDWRFFQAAPEDQQLERLRGDEGVLLDGMNASLPRVQSQLPRVMAVARRRSAGVADQPLEMRADMLVVDADRLVASLVWRGRFVVESPEVAARTQVLVGIEQPGKSVDWAAAVPAAASGPVAASAPVAVSAPVAAAAPAAVAPPVAGGSFATETREVDVQAILGKMGRAVPFAAGRESSLPAPSKPASGTPLSTGTGAVDLNKLFQGVVPFPGGKGPTPAPAPAAEKPTLPFAPADPSRPSKESAPTPAANKPAPMYTGTTDVDLAQLMKGAVPYAGPGIRPPAAVESPRPLESPATPAAVESPRPLESPAMPMPAAVESPRPLESPAMPAAVESPRPLESPAMPAAILPPAAVGLARTLGSPRPLESPPPPAALESPGPLESAAPPLPAPSPVTQAAPVASSSEAVLPAPAVTPPSPAALARKRAEVLLAAGQGFDGEELAGANLSGLDFSGRSMVRCDLRGAKLRGANLSGAKLASARLDEADLRGALLVGATLEGASLVKADLERANLSGCSASGANLTGASLRGAEVGRGGFAEALFGGAVLQEVRGAGANFAGARLVRADLGSATLPGASFRGAVLAFANLERANLQKADLRGANWHGATRTMTKLMGADITGVEERAPVEEA